MRRFAGSRTWLETGFFSLFFLSAILGVRVFGIGIGMCFEEFEREMRMHVNVVLDTPLCLSGS